MILRALASLLLSARLLALAVPFLAVFAAGTGPAHAQFLAGQLENLLSTEDRTVRITGLSGALSGNIRIEEVTVADRDGVWLTATDLALDWSPLALVRRNVSVENLSAARIVLDRLPRASATPAPADDEGGGFSLPSITADVQRIAIGEFVLGEAVADVPARLSAEASLQIQPDPARITADATLRRLDQEGNVALRLAFAPDENRLEISVQASEPAGGLVAGLLDIPGAPSVALSVEGSGPFSQFAANGTLDLGTERAATLRATTATGTDGRQVSVDLTALTQPFVPEQYLGTVGDDLRLQADVLLRNDGAIAIRTGDLVSGNLQLQANGTLDRSGPANDLTVALRTDERNPVFLAFGGDGARTALEIASLDARLQGAFSSAAVNLAARARTVGFESYVANEVEATAASPSFDLNNLVGPVTLDLRAVNSSVPQGIATRVLEGPIRLEAVGALTAEGFGFETTRLTTGTAEVNLAGNAALNFSTFALAIQSRFETAALDSRAVPYVGPNVAINAGSLTRAADGSFAVRDLVVDGEALDIQGSASLTGEELEAAVTGQLDQAALADPALAGRANFTLDAGGTLNAPEVDLVATASDLTVAGRVLQALDARVQGTFAAEAPSATVAVNATYNNEPLQLNTVLATGGDVRRLQDLVLLQGANRVEGTVALDGENRASGDLRLAVPDASTLLRLAGQTGSGDLSGTVNLSVGNGGTPVADVDLASGSFEIVGETGTTSLSGADIDLRVTNYLEAPLAAGRIQASRIEAGGLTVAALDTQLETVNDATAVNASVEVNDVPIRLAGDVAQATAGTVIAVRRLEADIPDAAVRLQEPATVTLGSLRTTISRMVLAAGDGSLAVEGSFGDELDLDLALDNLPLALANPFVADLDAAGTASGTASLGGVSASPDLDFDLRAADVATSQTRAAGLQPIDAVAAGTLRDGTTTLTAARVDLGSGAEIVASGTVGTSLDLDLRLVDIPVALANGFVDDLGASGLVNGTAEATGSLENPSVRFDATGSDITARAVSQAGVPAFALDISGLYRGGTAQLDTARLSNGASRIEASGSVGRALDLQVMVVQLPAALANAVRPDLGAQGTIDGTASATGSISNPNVEFQLNGTELSAAPLRQSGLPSVALDAAGAYAAGTARIDRGRLTVGTGLLDISGTAGQTLDLRLQITELPVALANAVRPDLDLAGTINGSATATGSLADPSATFELAGTGLSAAPLRQSGVEPLTLDAAGTYADGSARIERGRVTVGAGSLDISGTAGRQLDLRVAIDRLPLALANAARADLDARGTLSGTATATGSLADPAATFDLSAADVSVRQTRDAGVPPIEAVAAGAFRAGTATLDRARVQLGTGAVTATGTVGQQLDVALTIENLPASLAAAAAPDLAPSGTINGTVNASGSLSVPNVRYDLRGTGLSAQPLRDAGVGPLDLSADGAFADNTVTLQSANVSGGGIQLAASGTVGLAGPTLDLRVNGTAPLSIANRILAENGRSVGGTVALDVAVTGTPSAPNATGTITARNASFVDTGANLRIENINANVALNGQSANLDVSGQLGGGGNLSVTGTIGLGAGFPANLRIDVAGGRYADGELVSVEVDAGLTLTGPLTGNAVLAGTVNAREINILVPDNLPTSLARIDLERRNAPAAVLQQIREIDPSSGASGQSGGGGIQLDVTLNAPNRVFVRGRGLDLELGGTIRITGPISNLGIAGAFELQRGRFQLLSRRLDFARANLTFDGNLLPTLDLLATSDTGDGVTVNVAITGPANNPSFNFSSNPALPQDEVLARLIFGQSTADLSPLQIAQLASAAAQLAGVGGSTNLLDSLRAQLGVDDLDIRTNADGQTAVGVGRYLNENTYVGVDSTGRVSIDLELGRDIKARGAVTAGGGGEVGIFYEREY